MIKNNKVSATQTPNDNIHEQPKQRNSRNFNEDGDEEVENQEEQKNNRKINSMKKLSV